LDPHRLHAVFEPFAKEASAAYGTGLGLAVARGVVEAMGGRIWAENNAGAGSTVRFELDAGACEAEARELAEPAREQPAPLQGHILIVDDNATNRTVASMLVEMFGCTCETAEDGLEGVGAVAEGRFDAVLMDIRMPGMDGVAATRAIRGLPGAPGTIPIVALTANADQDDAQAYRAAGMACVVEKPIKADRLLLALAQALSIDRSAPADRPVAAAA
jgi:CheY-like chemotaxis protein